MKSIWSLSLAGIVAACASVQDDATSRFYGFEGAWQGAGTFQGMPSVVSAQFAPGESGQWLLNIEISAQRDGQAPITFSGEARYAMGENGPTGGSWTDSNGGRYQIVPRIEQGVLVVDWGEGAPMVGRSEYRIQDDGDLQIDDFVRGKDGSLRRFANAELDKQAR